MELTVGVRCRRPAITSRAVRDISEGNELFRIMSSETMISAGKAAAARGKEGPCAADRYACAN